MAVAVAGWAATGAGAGAGAGAAAAVVAGRMEGVGEGRHPPQGEEGVAVLRGPSRAARRLQFARR